MPVVEQSGGMRAGRCPVGADHHSLAGRQPVVLDHPGRLTGRGSEAVECGVEVGRAVDGFAGGGSHPGGRHHILGEGLRTLDARGVSRRPETRDAGRPHRVGHPVHQRYLRTDHHQIGPQAPRQGGHPLRGGGVDVHLVGDRRGAGVAGRDGQVVDLRILAQRHEKGVLAGTGSDHEDAHSDTLDQSDPFRRLATTFSTTLLKVEPRGKPT